MVILLFEKEKKKETRGIETKKKIEENIIFWI